MKKTTNNKLLTYQEKIELSIKAGKLFGSGDFIFDSDLLDTHDKSWYTFVGFREIKQRVDNEIKYYLIGILESKEGVEQEMALQLIVEYFQDKTIKSA